MVGEPAPTRLWDIFYKLDPPSIKIYEP